MSADPQSASVIKSAPAYFKEVHSLALRRWEQLDADPGLAGPWRQMFSQVQSPRHVLSELLQNADDAGATEAIARLQNGVFTFEHNGADFTPEQLGSLCQFGYSNKRTLHTIGFRGIGFKSTFSLGPRVEVHTRSLSIRFDQRRFTLPAWLDSGIDTEGTVVSVAIDDQHRELELRKNLDEWRESPTSLLFFKNVSRLVIGDVVLQKVWLEPGPVPNSDWFRLEGVASHRVLIAKSAEESFPDDAMAEIKRERFADDITLPPCSVEIVLGLPGPQRLFVVLPTGVEPHVPFSCNAPFVQDPARLGIKSPAVSPTNRWLLGRAGALAASVMQGWLRNGELPQADRASAYGLLPPTPKQGDSISQSVGYEISNAFANSLDRTNALLASDGTVTPQRQCFSPPRVLYSVWAPSQLLQTFSEGLASSLLEFAIDDRQRALLCEWGLLVQTAAKYIIQQLEVPNFSPPRPITNESIATLWRFVDQQCQPMYSTRPDRRLAIVPVAGSDHLHRAERVIISGAPRKQLRLEDWEWLRSYQSVVCDRWLAFIEDTDKGTKQTASIAYLRTLGLSETSSNTALVEHAAAKLFGSATLQRTDCVRFAHVLAALGEASPSAMQFVCRDGFRRDVSTGIMVDDSRLDGLLPAGLAEQSVLHSEYDQSCGVCSVAQWQEWSRSELSGLRTIAAVQRVESSKYSRRDLVDWLAQRGVPAPLSYQYARECFKIADWTFRTELLAHWTATAANDAGVWCKVLCSLLDGPASHWRNILSASVFEQSNTMHRRSLRVSDVPAAWVCTLRGLPCIPDTHGVPRVPAELLRRTPNTEPLLGTVPFVSVDLDRPDNHDLLTLLGVRSTPAGVGSLLDRVRALAEAPKPPIRELGKWYDALDRVLTRRRPDDLESIKVAFASDRLIYSDQGEWVRSTEVFQQLGEDDPAGLPVLHSEFASLAMWSLIGVVTRPTPDVLISHLQSIESGVRLDGQELARLRSILPRMPARIWDECEHWLSLDGSWQPTSTFDCVLFDDTSLRVRELFPQIKQRTADCRSLSGKSQSLSCFSGLRDLGQSIDSRLIRKQHDLPPAVAKPWIRALGVALARITLQDADQQAAVRAASIRLASTAWQTFSVLSVTPLMDGVPAGQDHDPDVLWDESTLFVRQGSLAARLDAVVAELSRHFPGESFQRAIRNCIERDEQFVAEYLAGAFTLSDHDDPADADQPASTGSAAQPTSGSQSPNAGSPQGDGSASAREDDDPPASPDAERDDFEDDSSADGPKKQTRDRKPRDVQASPTLITKFAASKGFRWNEDQGLYFHPDGSQIVKSEGAFQWEHRSGENTIRRYWTSEQCLTKSGVELGADIWDIIKKWPDTHSLILTTEDHLPITFHGIDLVRMVQGESLKLYPAKYRLKKSENH